MASDFYKRTKDLYEEFKKRELQYVNAERATRSHFQIINENSMPVQEYLEKLNKSERETEETYHGLMHHMEQLDHCTESIADKLQKLESLKVSMNYKAPTWPYSKNTDDSFSHDYTGPLNALKTDNTSSDYFSHPNQFALSKQKVEYASTQTDLMFCENCQFPISLSTERPYDFLSPINLNTVVQPFQNHSLSSQVVENETVSDKAVPFHDEDKTSVNLHKEENLERLSVITQSPSKISEENPVQKETSLNKYQTISTDISLSIPPNTKSLENETSTTVVSTTNEIQPKNQTISTDTSLSMPPNTKSPENETSTTVVSITSETQPKTNIPTTDNIENVAGEKLNKKGNILNFNKKESDSNLHSSVIPEGFDPSQINKGSDLTTSIVIDDLSSLSVNQNISQFDSEGETSTSKISTKKSALNQEGQNEKQSESPISIGGAPSPSLHSDNISAVSDSDSYDETERLKDSAAYQALLGNVSVTKKIQKTTTYSESESEDEVERALATATRKISSAPITTNVQEEKPDDSHKIDAVEPKAKNEPRKSISLSKTQQLSKSTRKVLGMDTSSGSEGEIRIPAKPDKKIEEDSDEFDFYD